jgi:hypothetical protein
VFHSNRNRGDEDGLFETDVSDAGRERFLVRFGLPSDWSQDGRFILSSVSVGSKVSVLPMTGNTPLNPQELPFSNPTGGFAKARLSPDGRWIAYTSKESGTDQVFVGSFPKGDGRWPVSSLGGSEPRWRGDGKELVYLSTDGRVVAVPLLAQQNTLEVGSPTPLFGTNAEGTSLAILGAAQYVMTRDGQRFLVNQPVQRGFSITVVVNWRAALKQ